MSALQHLCIAADAGQEAKAEVLLRRLVAGALANAPVRRDGSRIVQLSNVGHLFRKCAPGLWNDYRQKSSGKKLYELLRDDVHGRFIEVKGRVQSDVMILLDVDAAVRSGAAALLRLVATVYPPHDHNPQVAVKYELACWMLRPLAAGHTSYVDGVDPFTVLCAAAGQYLANWWKRKPLSAHQAKPFQGTLFSFIGSDPLWQTSIAGKSEARLTLLAGELLARAAVSLPALPVHQPYPDRDLHDADAPLQASFSTAQQLQWSEGGQASPNSDRSEQDTYPLAGDTLFAPHRGHGDGSTSDSDVDASELEAALRVLAGGVTVPTANDSNSSSGGGSGSQGGLPGGFVAISRTELSTLLIRALGPATNPAAKLKHLLGRTLGALPCPAAAGDLAHAMTLTQVDRLFRTEAPLIWIVGRAKANIIAQIPDIPDLLAQNPDVFELHQPPDTDSSAASCNDEVVVILRLQQLVAQHAPAHGTKQLPELGTQGSSHGHQRASATGDNDDGRLGSQDGSAEHGGGVVAVRSTGQQDRPAGPPTRSERTEQLRACIESLLHGDTYNVKIQRTVALLLLAAPYNTTSGRHAVLSSTLGSALQQATNGQWVGTAERKHRIAAGEDVPTLSGVLHGCPYISQAKAPCGTVIKLNVALLQQHMPGRAGSGGAVSEGYSAYYHEGGTRPHMPVCNYWLRHYGVCHYGPECVLNHPDKSMVTQLRRGLPDEAADLLKVAHYPSRPHKSACTNFAAWGVCRFRRQCQYDHPAAMRATTLEAAQRGIEQINAKEDAQQTYSTRSSLRVSNGILPRVVAAPAPRRSAQPARNSASHNDWVQHLAPRGTTQSSGGSDGRAGAIAVDADGWQVWPSDMDDDQEDAAQGSSQQQQQLGFQADWSAGVGGAAHEEPSFDDLGLGGSEGGVDTAWTASDPSVYTDKAGQSPSVPGEPPPGPDYFILSYEYLNTAVVVVSGMTVLLPVPTPWGS